MPIIDYEREAVTSERTFFSNPKISQVNKETVKTFLKSYDVHAATKSKFFRHIPPLFYELTDFKTDMNDRDKVNTAFLNIKNNWSKGYQDAIVQCSLKLARWLNDGELPKGMKDVRNIKKVSKPRNQSLLSSDMWTMDDISKMSEYTESVQIKAILYTQLDIGARPSEFIDLNYGDVIINKDVVVFRLNGKTGQRDCVALRSVPQFLKWYYSHPTKKRTDPLWLMEANFLGRSHPKEKPSNESKVRRYNYAALTKRIKLMAQKAGINKPTDFYLFRHSSCILDKNDNLPLDLAASRHGHSVKFFSKIYGVQSDEGIANRYRKHYGTPTQEQKKPPISSVCPRCDYANELKSEFCYKCNYPLSVEAVIKNSKNPELDEMKTQMNEMRQLILDNLHKAPTLTKKDIELGRKAKLIKTLPEFEQTPENATFKIEKKKK